MNVLLKYFTAPRSISLPQKDEKCYKYQVGDLVRVEMNRQQRLFSFRKFSLLGGKCRYVSHCVYTQTLMGTNFNFR